MLEKIIDMYDNKYTEIEDWKSEDKRAIWLQDEFFIKNYSMRVAPNWTTIKNIKKDRERMINDSTYQNYLIFLFKVKSRMNEEWGKLRGEMIKLNDDISLRLEELVKK